MAENTKKTTLKKYGKIVPVAVAGFVAVSAGTMDAQAEELDINTTDVTPDEEQKTEAAAASTEIKEVTYGDTTTEAETGETTKEGAVNVGVDVNDDGSSVITNDGTITVTETPVSSETTSDTVTNDDGSTTTTTTTTTDSKVEIDGEVSSGVTDAAATDEDKVKEDEVNDVIEGKDDIKGALEDKYGEGNVTGSKAEEGNTVTETYKVTVEDISPAEDKPLTDTELKEILKVDDLKAVEGETGTYTYTDETGATVTVKVTDDSSKETTTTKWTIKVTKVTETKSESEDVAKEEINNSNKVGETLSAKDILAEVNKGADGEFADATIETSEENGVKTTVITDGSKTYTITYKETEVDTTGLTADEILSLLPEGYTKDDDGKIFDAEGHELSISTDNLLKYTVAVSVTLTDTQGSQVDGANSADADDITEAKVAAMAAAEENAAQNAVASLKAQGIVFDEGAKATKNDDGKWTVKDKEGKEYTFTITATIDPETGEAKAWTPTEDIKGYVPDSGLQHTVTGSAVVDSGKVVWTETDGYDDIKLTEGKIDAASKLFNDETLLEISEDGTMVKTQVTNEDGSVTTKTYTFTYDAKLTDAEKEKYKDYTDITKITWTVETKTTTENNTQSVITSGVTKNDDGTYTFKDGDKDITLEKGEDGKYTYDDENGTVYILEEEDVPLADADIIAMIADKYGVDKSKVTIKEGKTATFNKDGAEVTVSYKDAKTLTVKKTVTETSNPETLETFGSTGVDKMIDEIKKTVANAGENAKYYITVDGTEYQLSVQDGKLVGLVDGAVQKDTEALKNWLQNDPNVKDERNEALQGDDLKTYLDGLKKDEDGQEKKVGIGNHIDLVAAGEMDVNGSKTDYVILDDGLQFVWNSSAEQIVKGNGTDIADSLRNNISCDWGKTFDPCDDHYEYASKPGSQVQNQPNKDGKVGIPQNSAYYKVSGKVAYDCVGYCNTWMVAEACVSILKIDGYDNAIWVQVGNHYEVYRHQADLTAYGYMDQDSNVCGLRNDCNPKNNGGYDLKLQNLTLVGNTVSATVGKVNHYSINLTKKTETTDDSFASGSSLTLTGQTTVTVTEQNGTPGSDLSGSYEVTKTLDVTNAEDGTGTANYYTYKTWETTTANGSASGTRYDGTLDYTYEVVGEPKVEVTGKTVEKDRVVDVELKKTTEKTEETTTPAPTPTDPGTNPGPGTTPDPNPNPGTNPGSGTTPDPDPNPGTNPGPGTTPDPEPTDIADEDVPLTEMPDGEGSLTEIPDGEIPLSEIPEDVEIPDEEVPMAMVPKTGDASMSWFLAAIASALGLAGLTIADRKRKSEDAE